MAKIERQVEIVHQGRISTQRDIMNNTPRIRNSLYGIVLLLLLAGFRSDAPPPWPLPPGVKTLTVNGYPMAYLERGSGPAIVLVHGALLDYRYWTPQLASLSSRYRVIAVSLRHYYPERWDGKGDDFSRKTHAEDLAAFIERLGVGPVTVVAHSRGGAVALDAAMIRPDLIKKLVLMEPSVVLLRAAPAHRAGCGPRSPRNEAIAAYFAKGDVEGGLAYFTDLVYGPGAWKRSTEEQRRIARDNAWTIVPRPNDPRTFACNDLRKLTMPVLLVGSEKGSRSPRNVLQEAERCLASATRITIPNAGHQMNIDNPAAFDKALKRFLSP